MVDKIDVFKQNSIRIKSDVGTIYIDPFKIDDETHDADFILITHDHYDHFSSEDIAKVKKDTTVLVVPEKMEAKAVKESGIKEIETVKPGTYHEIGNLELETIPAYNLLKPFHPKAAGWVGYILKINGKRIYIAGDTDATKEAKEVICDIALVPIGGTYTMDAKKAAELVNEINPEVVIPTHYGSIVGKLSDAKVFAANVKDTIKVVEKIK
ncbi:MAG: MBL fold metallo-hydrolase [Lachnospiraceae bacterium]|nr:MBL fold metallo-hydrolase [Lachnospiraceae bacterium]